MFLDKTTIIDDLLLKRLPFVFLQDGIVFTFNCCRGDSYERI